MIGSNLFGPNYYRPLSDEEGVKVKLLETQMNSAKQSDNVAAIQSLRDASQEDLVRWTKESPVLKKYCENNERLQSVWIETLKTHYKKSPLQGVESQQGVKEKHTIFHHYISAYLVNSYLSYEHIILKAENNYSLTPLKLKVESLLAEACEYGSYHALLRRSKQSCENLLAGKKVDIDLIYNDTVRLGSLYGSIGYLQAGNRLLDLSFYFTEDDRDIDRGIAFFEQGVKNYLCALLLLPHEYSQQLIQQLTEGGGLSSTFDAEGDGIALAEAFADPIKAKMLLSSWVSKENFAKLEIEARREVEPILKAKLSQANVVPTENTGIK